ncbi:MAG: amidohydrolase family protein, partial [Nitrospirota bacterium]
RKSGVKVHISHIKTSGEKNWHKMGDAVSMIEEARKIRVRITADRYPYVAAATDLDSILPNWTYEGGNKEELKRIRDTGMRSRIKREVLREHSEKKYWSSVIISTVSSRKNKWMEGKSIAEIAGRKKSEPVDTLLRILGEEKLRAGAIFLSMNEENLRSFISLPYVMVGTDSSARSFTGPTRKGKPHPRGFGSFPRFLGRYVRDEGLIRLTEAIHKITLLPARTFGIEKRGVLRNNAFADIVVFDYDKLRDLATFDEPFLKPEGVHFVIVNGKPVIWEGEPTGNRPGRVLKHGR